METVEIHTLASEEPVTVLAVPEDNPLHADRPNLVGALAAVANGVSRLDHALAAVVDDLADGDALAVLYLLSEIRDSRKHLAQIEAVVEAKAAALMDRDRLEAPDLLAIRRSGNVRKAWDKPRMVSRVAERAAAEYGEGDEVQRQIARAAVEFAYAVGTPSWKVTALKQAGVAYDDACETERGRRTVEVLRGEAAELAAQDSD